MSLSAARDQQKTATLAIADSHGGGRHAASERDEGTYEGETRFLGDIAERGEGPTEYGNAGDHPEDQAAGVRCVG